MAKKQMEPRGMSRLTAREARPRKATRKRCRWRGCRDRSKAEKNRVAAGQVTSTVDAGRCWMRFITRHGLVELFADAPSLVRNAGSRAVLNCRTLNQQLPIIVASTARGVHRVWRH